MNNLDWYTKVTLFCKAYQSCTECPFFLMEIQDKGLPFEEKRCFTSRQELEKLSSWLSESSQQEQELMSCGGKEDNQWLKDLLKGQFGEEEEDMDAFYLEDDLF
ncbi:MAG TPA: hypothetical protein VJ863_07680 [Sphaerochaeta sp.]|nr:hypothetical protein [Sphaerochaeta sp.]